MWLLKFHIAVSILCLLTCDGFLIACKKGIEENGWTSVKKSLFRRIVNHWIYFIPLMNVLAIVTTFMMISVKKSKYNKFIKEHGGENEQNNKN